jgi:type II secretory pathway component GspD/PulD (secretin)
LVESKANLSSDIIKQLKEEENNYLLSLDDRSSGNYKVTERLEQYKKDLKAYKKLSEQTSVTFNNQPIISGLSDLSKRAGLIPSFPEEENSPKEKLEKDSLKERGYLRGQYSGTLLEVIEKISSDFKLKLSFKPDMKTIVFSNKYIPENINKLSAEKIKDTFAVANDSQIINEVITEISKKNDELTEEEISGYIQKVESKSAKNFVSLLLHQINQEQIHKKKNADLSLLRKSIIAYSEAAKDSIKTIATFNPELKNGNEKVIEKFSVFNDTPENMEQLLTSYSVFKEKCSTTQDKNGNSKKSNSPQVVVAQAGSQINLVNDNSQGKTNAIGSNVKKENSDNKNSGNSNNSSSAIGSNGSKINSDNKSLTNSNNSLTSVNNKDNQISGNSDSAKQDTQSETLITQSDPSFVSAELTGCVTINKDATGVLVAGTVVESQLAARFISDQDKPVKQALLEIYILEVSNNWQSELKTAIAKNFKGGASLSPLGLDISSNGISFSSINANKFNIQALINALETNYLGRKVSNPSILIKDGGTGKVSKTRTNREKLLTAGVVSSVGTTGNSEKVSELEAPLNLEVTANINKHNDNIELDFNYSETQLDTSAVTSPTTKNEIKAKLIAQPNQIIIMAGLKKENNFKEIDGLPGTLNLGPLSTLSAWFNGRQAAGNNGSELLVFIKPTVITNLNSDRIIKQVNY